jgi:hypothetical protein
LAPEQALIRFAALEPVLIRFAVLEQDAIRCGVRERREFQAAPLGLALIQFERLEQALIPVEPQEPAAPQGQDETLYVE